MIPRSLHWDHVSKAFTLDQGSRVRIVDSGFLLVLLDPGSEDIGLELSNGDWFWHMVLGPGPLFPKPMTPNS